MIIVQICGGLGNQMFQYALGRHLSLLQDCALNLDIENSRNPRLGREYRLHHFQIKAGICTWEDRLKLGLIRRQSLVTLVRRTLDPLLPIHKRRHVKEARPGFDPRILRIRSGAYLDGCWESRHYFEPIAQTLKEDFRPKTSLSTEALDLLKEIQAGETVSIHVRRGDFVSDPRTRGYHGVLSLNYYFRAVAVLRERLVAPRFLVFSDDPEWCRREFSAFPDLQVPPTCGKFPDYEDLFLMSQCRHHIIANSTFSWWSAWLGRNPSRFVVAPSNFLTSFSDQQRQDLYPPEWLLIENT